MTVKREQLEADVLIVGAGPAGLACALHLANLIKKHNEARAKTAGGAQLSPESIYVLEKGREVGAHQLSGAIMNPKALAELVPDYEKSAPLDTPVTDDAAFFFTKNSAYRMPITPPPFKNKRSEEHTSELQSLAYLVCRLLLEKKKKRAHYRLRH